MASGVTVSDTCRTIYDEIKNSKYRYVILYIRDERQVDVEMVGQRNAGYDQFLNDMQKSENGECRFGIFDYEYTYKCEGSSLCSKRQKMFIMAWCPDTARIKNKTLYSSTFLALMKSLGLHKCLQVSEISEASREVVEAKLRAADSQ